MIAVGGKTEDLAGEVCILWETVVLYSGWETGDLAGRIYNRWKTVDLASAGYALGL